MNKNGMLLGVVISVILVGGCVQQEDRELEGTNESGVKEPLQEIPDTGSAETGGNKSAAEIQEQKSQPEEKPQEVKPVLKNLGVNIEPWDKSTNLAGDLIFSRKLLFEDSNIINKWVFVEFGGAGQRKTDPAGSNIEYWFFTPLGTPVRAPVDGRAQVVFFEHTQDWGVNIQLENPQYIVSFEHVVNVKVKDGDFVKAGEVVAEAAPRSTFGGEVAMTELAVWAGGVNVVKYCPFLFLEESLKPAYEGKFKQLAKDWEEFVGEDVYEEEKWVAPGCLLDKILEK